MPAAVELDKAKELPFNPGEIIVVDGWPRWVTETVRHKLMLDIVPVPRPESKFGIASFVVMEQEQTFLNDVGKILAEAIASQLPDREIILLTVESKGSHFIPWVWKNLTRMAGERLWKRIVSFRKGEPKVYMKRPVIISGQEVVLSPVPFYSITSTNEQKLNISPKDAEFLCDGIEKGVKPVPVDDFIGEGGTAIAVYRLFQQLGLEPPDLVAVVGSDGGLYKQTLTREGINITLLPQPLPLRLPTFHRQNELEPWQINM